MTDRSRADDAQFLADLDAHQAWLADMDLLRRTADDGQSWASEPPTGSRGMTARRLPSARPTPTASTGPVRAMTL